ncbi:transporter substrate-binding domain-containing protein [Pseudomonas sp. K2I15]|uniref:transporter substrate-binding domain-containing protein n=1 Tax=unclassified Pseudomonas TaxID=196821 RepID=UPI0015957E65|nr:transporter substrate-binding domain-containing protein [Pseudomonas sp. K2I15]
MTSLRILLALVLSTATGTLCSVTYAAEKTLAEIRFGVEALVPPFESRNAQGELVGLNIELGNALCAELKARCVWVDQEYATNLAALEASRFDAIMPMSATPARRQKIDFTDNLYALETRLVARKRLGLVPEAKALQGKRIGVLAGTSREAYALARWVPYGVVVRSFNLNAELISSLLAGDIDATLQDTLEISDALLKTPEGAGFEFAGPEIVDEMLGSGVAIGVRKGEPDLRMALNQALQRLKESGQYSLITQRYLRTSNSDPVPMLYTPAEGSLPFSQTVQVGQTLYISGLLGLDERGKLVSGGIRAQTAKALETLRSILEEKGLGMDRVAKCTVILANINDFAAMNKVYTHYFSANRLPTRTTFAAGGLILDARVEIECLASF